MKGNKKKRSIFDKCDVSESQEIYLQRCDFAIPGQLPPDSDPSVALSPPLNDVIASHRDSETDSVIGSGYNDDAVESQAIRFVSPEESADTVDSEDDVADPTVVMAEKQKDVPVEPKVDEEGGKKLKIPLRDVVKAIVMNSRNTDEEEEEDKKIEKMSCVQILLSKGFKF